METALRKHNSDLSHPINEQMTCVPFCKPLGQSITSSKHTGS